MISKDIPASRVILPPSPLLPVLFRPALLFPTHSFILYATDKAVEADETSETKNFRPRKNAASLKLVPCNESCLTRLAARGLT